MIEAAFATNVGVLQGPNEGHAFRIRVNLHNLENLHGSCPRVEVRNFSTLHFFQCSVKLSLGTLISVSSISVLK